MKRSVSALAIVGLLAGPAHAQRSDRTERADALFKKGKQLLNQKRYPEACTAFEDSDRLDPGIGAKLNVARCYQEWGKLATAWRWFTDAERMAVKANDERASKIRELVDELDESVPRLTVSAPAGVDVDHVVVKLDGSELAHAKLGVELRVDPGPHQIDTIVNGIKRSKTIPVERGGSAEVTIELPETAVAGDTGQRVTRRRPVEYDPEQRGRRTRQLTGLGIAGGGLAIIGVAGFVTLRARSNYNYALDAHCNGSTSMCDDIGLDTTSRARSRANIATILTIGGVAAVAGGLTLVYLARRSSPSEPARAAEAAFYLTPQLTPDGGGLVAGGTF